MRIDTYSLTRVLSKVASRLTHVSIISIFHPVDGYVNFYLKKIYQNYYGYITDISRFDCVLEICRNDKIDRSTVDSPYKGQWRGALIFSLICAWTNGWISVHRNRDPFVNGPSQWETTLHYNVVSHWLGAYTKWFLCNLNHGVKWTPSTNLNQRLLNILTALHDNF